MATDRVTLTVPAKSEYAKTVRMTAATLVSRMEMSYDDVDDVRIAAEESFIYAIETLPADSDVRFEFHVDENEIGIDVGIGSEDLASNEEAERRAAYAGFILDAVSDSFEFTSDESGPCLHLVKRIGDIDDDQE